MKIEITLEPIPEDITPEKAEKLLGAKGFAKSVRQMQKQDQLWGWCEAVVHANVWSGIRIATATTTLGGCSYAGELDFIKSGYFNDMALEAVTEALGKLVDDPT